MLPVRKIKKKIVTETKYFFHSILLPSYAEEIQYISA